MWLAIAAVVVGLVILVWSADKFVEGAAAVAQRLGMSPLLIGMLIIGFGTSAPEMVVSALASIQGNPALALGNAYGSNITNIALILGITALLAPITVISQVLRRELPLLLFACGITAWILLDYQISQLEAWILLAVFFAYIGLSIYLGMKHRDDPLVADTLASAEQTPVAMKAAIFWLLTGLVLLVLSSRMLVWGAVDIATALGVSDLVIGLTVVAIGTSLPELASAIAAARKNEHDLALGNILGSNMFNTLAVVGIAGAIHPIDADPLILSRDWLAMTVLTVLILVLSLRRGGRTNRINRTGGVLLLSCYIAYTLYLLYSGFVAPAAVS